PADGFRVYPPASKVSVFVPFEVQACQQKLDQGPQMSVSAVGRSNCPPRSPLLPETAIWPGQVFRQVFGGRLLQEVNMVLPTTIWWPAHSQDVACWARRSRSASTPATSTTTAPTPQAPAPAPASPPTPTIHAPPS